MAGEVNSNSSQTDQLIDWIRNRYFGKYRGLVTDNNDPTVRGRIKVQVPAVLGDLESWAMPCLPYSGNRMGSYAIPEVGAGVWVEFEAGDASYPIWSGGFWADNELPQNEQGTTASPGLKIFRTSEGLMATFDDTSKVITLSDQNGSNILTIDAQQGKIRISANLKVVVEAPQIELVENSTHPLVFGDNLLTYLTQLVTIYNTHMHPGELALGVLPVTPAPPVAPMTPPTPSLLSFKVKTG
ncbi:MAG: phage baseplate assembly protein V [Bacteroidia bacterium]|nr:phage baseplate assembly protein V [Bacteroidia bacterium]